MRRSCLIALVAICCASASHALAHGFKIDLVNNKLVLTSEDPQANPPNTSPAIDLYGVQNMLGPAAFRSSDHPGYEVISGISTNSTISFDVLSPLLYSTGGAPVPSPVGVDMVITPLDLAISGSVTVKGTTGFQNGFLIGKFDGSTLGDLEHQLNYEIDVVGGVPAGAYGLAMRLTGKNGAGQSFISSDPFVAVFNNGIAIGAFPGVAKSIYAAAIPAPEPSTLVMGVLGAVGLLAFGRRRALASAARRAQRSLTVLVVLAVLAPAAARAHGIPMTFHVNGATTFESDQRAYHGNVPDPAEHHDTVFLAGTYTLTGQPATNSLQFTAAFATTDPPASNGIALHSTWGFDIVGPLRFWDPVLGLQPTNVVATVVRSGIGFSVDKNTAFLTGGTLVASGGGYPATNGFHNSVTVNIPPGSPVGLYALGFDVRSTVNASFPGLPNYGTSNLFYAIGTNGLSDADYQRGLVAFNAIGVPEPSSLMLLAIGAGAMAFRGWRRRVTRAASF